MAQMRTIAGMIGPFIPPQKSTVPIWIACELKKRRKCRIVGPPWMAVDNLEALLRLEVTQPGFSSLPFRYLEVSKMLLDVASDDIPLAERLHTLLKDLREARQAKSHQGLEALNVYRIEMTNIGQIELNELRPFFTLAHKRLVQLAPEAQVENEDQNGMQDDDEFY